MLHLFNKILYQMLGFCAVGALSKDDDDDDYENVI